MSARLGSAGGGRAPHAAARPRPLLLTAIAALSGGTGAAAASAVPLVLRLQTSRAAGAGTAGGARVAFKVGGVWLAEEELCTEAAAGSLTEAHRILQDWPSHIRLRAPTYVPPFLDAWGLEQISIVHAPSGRAVGVLEPCAQGSCDFREGSDRWIYSSVAYSTYAVPFVTCAAGWPCNDGPSETSTLTATGTGTSSTTTTTTTTTTSAADFNASAAASEVGGAEPKPHIGVECTAEGGCEEECIIRIWGFCVQWWMPCGFIPLLGSCFLVCCLKKVHLRLRRPSKKWAASEKDAEAARKKEDAELAISAAADSAAAAAPPPLLLGTTCKCEGGAAPEVPIKLESHREDDDIIVEDCAVPPLVSAAQSSWFFQLPLPLCMPEAAGSSSSSKWRFQPSAPSNLQPAATDLEKDAEDHVEQLLGTWSYSNEGACFRLVVDEGRKDGGQQGPQDSGASSRGAPLRFTESLAGGGRLWGLLYPQRYWFQGKIFRVVGGSGVGWLHGTMRLFFAEELGCVQSNFKEVGKSEWGPDVLASRAEAAHDFDGAAKVAGPCVSSADSATRGVPRFLRVTSTSEMPSCTGDYRLLGGERPGGLPLWKKEAGNRWLYSGADGRWYVGGKLSSASSFNCAAGYLFCKSPHGGVLPHELEPNAWAWVDGGTWHEDASIKVSAKASHEAFDLQAPVWCEGDDRPGAYTVIHSDTPVFAELAVASTRRVTYIPCGIEVKVSEVVLLAEDNMVRGCVEEPFGWINLFDLKDGYRWAVRLQPEEADMAVEDWKEASTASAAASSPKSSHWNLFAGSAHAAPQVEVHAEKARAFRLQSVEKPQVQQDAMEDEDCEMETELHPAHGRTLRNAEGGARRAGVWV